MHLWAQIVGKVRMASTAPRNHWWHVTLYVDVRGLTTRRMHAPGGVAFEIDFDFVDHRLVISTNRGEVESFELVDGLSVAEFDEKLHATLAAPGDRRRDPRRAVPGAGDDTVPGRPGACVVRPRCGRALLARPRVDGRSARGVRGLVLRKDEPRPPLLARRSTSRSPASAARVLRRCRKQAPSTRRRTRTRWSRAASGRATRTCASRASTRTPPRSLPTFVSSRCTLRRPSGASREAARSRCCPTTRFGGPRTRELRSLRSWRARTGRGQVSPAGIRRRSPRPGVRAHRS